LPHAGLLVLIFERGVRINWPSALLMCHIPILTFGRKTR
jgi:ABC-type phosphate transport system auxiliary subunit